MQPYTLALKLEYLVTHLHTFPTDLLKQRPIQDFRRSGSREVEYPESFEKSCLFSRWLLSGIYFADSVMDGEEGGAVSTRTAQTQSGSLLPAYSVILASDQNIYQQKG